MDKAVQFFILLGAVVCLSVGSEAGFFDNVFNLIIPKKHIRVKDWHLESCDTDYDVLQLHNINVLSSKDEVLVSGTVIVKTDLSAPVTVTVSMKRQFLGVWIKVPCIMDFGSCIYEDLCNYGYAEEETCPASFVQKHVPCRCPIAKGLYSIPEDVRISNPETLLGTIVNGRYWAKVQFVRNQSEIACYIASFTLETFKE